MRQSTNHGRYSPSQYKPTGLMKGELNRISDSGNAITIHYLSMYDRSISPAFRGSKAHATRAGPGPGTGTAAASMPMLRARILDFLIGERWRSPLFTKETLDQLRAVRHGSVARAIAVWSHGLGPWALDARDAEFVLRLDHVRSHIEDNIFSRLAAACVMKAHAFANTIPPSPMYRP
jgi:hypothetical protein